MGSHGRSGVSRLLWGSKAEEAVRDLACPVLVVKPLLSCRGQSGGHGDASGWRA
jgi:hypothetical protein